MNRFLIILLFALTVSSLGTSRANADEQRPREPATLTDTQIDRYLNSYLPVHEMASTHWGRRQFTPTNKMLPPQGTFERAIAEMRAAGTLPDFELLLHSHGFEDFDAWLRIGQRISFAFMTLRMESLDPAGLILKRQERKNQLTSIESRRTELLKQSDASNVGQLEALDLTQRQLERGVLADKDAEALRPYFKRFDDLNKQIIERER